MGHQQPTLTAALGWASLSDKGHLSMILIMSHAGCRQLYLTLTFPVSVSSLLSVIIAHRCLTLVSKRCISHKKGEERTSVERIGRMEKARFFFSRQHASELCESYLSIKLLSIGPVVKSQQHQMVSLFCVA